MWDLPGPGLEPGSPGLAGGFLTTSPPGKPEEGLLTGPGASNPWGIPFLSPLPGETVSSIFQDP